jgi:hypothetical protein
MLSVEEEHYVATDTEIMQPKVRVLLTHGGTIAKNAAVTTIDYCACFRYASPTMTTATVWSEMYRMFTLFGIIMTLVFALCSGISLNQIASETMKHPGSGSDSDSDSDNSASYTSTIAYRSALASVIMGFCASFCMFIASIVSCALSDYTKKSKNRSIVTAATIHLALLGMAATLLLAVSVVLIFADQHERQTVAMLSIVLAMGLPLLFVFAVVELYRLFIKPRIAACRGMQPNVEDVFD